MKKKNLLIAAILLIGLLMYFVINSSYIPENQRLEAYQNDRTSQISYERYCPNDPEKNYIDFDEKIINISIPITDDRLRIVCTKGLSTNKFNVLFIQLDGANGLETNLLPITSHLSAQLEIEKISGLDFTTLEKHDNLLVCVMHDDDVTRDDLNKFKEHFESNYDTYPERTICFSGILDTYYLKQKPDKKPKENGGGVIGGGG